MAPPQGTKGPRILALKRFVEFAERGMAFRATIGKQLFSGGADVFYLAPQSGARLRINKIIFVTDTGATAVYLYVYTDPTGTISGTAVVPQNATAGEGQTSGATSLRAVTGVSTHGNLNVGIPVVAGQQTILDFDSTLIIDQGHSLLITVDFTGTSIPVGVVVEFSEEGR